MISSQPGPSGPACFLSIYLPPCVMYFEVNNISANSGLDLPKWDLWGPTVKTVASQPQWKVETRPKRSSEYLHSMSWLSTQLPLGSKNKTFQFPTYWVSEALLWWISDKPVSHFLAIYIYCQLSVTRGGSLHWWKVFCTASVQAEWMKLQPDVTKGILVKDHPVSSAVGRILEAIVGYATLTVIPANNHTHTHTQIYANYTYYLLWFVNETGSSSDIFQWDIPSIIYVMSHTNHMPCVSITNPSPSPNIKWSNYACDDCCTCAL